MTETVPKNSLVARTLWRIETELAHAPRLEDLASAEGVSRFHMARAFSLATGRPVMAYVRPRRLSEAARCLPDGARSLISGRSRQAAMNALPTFPVAPVIRIFIIVKQ